MFYLLITAIGLLIAFNLYATRAILSSQACDARQKIWQTAFVWLIPVLGAFVALHIHREPVPSLSSGKETDYEAGDIYQSNRHFRESKVEDGLEEDVNGMD